jgi:hypothetical protein
MNDYILLKDLPNAKAGDVFKFIDGMYYKNGDLYTHTGFTDDAIKAAPEWFKKSVINEVDLSKTKPMEFIGTHKASGREIYKHGEDYYYLHEDNYMRLNGITQELLTTIKISHSTEPKEIKTENE